jgi:hypothetical protein
VAAVNLPPEPVPPQKPDPESEPASVHEPEERIEPEQAASKKSTDRQPVSSKEQQGSLF